MSAFAMPAPLTRIASVVPPLTSTLVTMVTDYFGRVPLLFEPAADDGALGYMFENRDLRRALDETARAADGLTLLLGAAGPAALSSGPARAASAPSSRTRYWTSCTRSLRAEMFANASSGATPF